MSESLLEKNELVSAVKGRIVDGCNADCHFECVATDSRNVCPQTLFVPLMGEFQNGHKYIPSAIEKGASVVFIMNDEYSQNVSVYKELVQKNSDVLFVLVENTLYALQNAAERYVEKFPSLTKICITGSCGKTTTKEILVSIFKSKYKDEVVYTKGNFNSETGLPLSVFNIRKNHRFGIFEMGMNRTDEIGEISKVLKANYGIITNIGNAHIGILGSRENIALEKRKAFNYINKNGAAVMPEDDDFVALCTKNVGGKIILAGEKSLEYVKFIKDDGLTGCDFSVDGVKMHLPLSGKYNYKNALLCVALAKELGFSAAEIKTGIENAAAVSGRMEICREKIYAAGTDGNNAEKELVMIKDFYNANPDSMNKAIEFCAGLDCSERRYYVLADMKELGDSSKEAHSQIGLKLCSLVNAGRDYVILIGEEMKYCFDSTDKKISNAFWFKASDSDSFNEISKIIRSSCNEGDIVLIKGSHSMNLEALVPLITGKEV